MLRPESEIEFDLLQEFQRKRNSLFLETDDEFRNKDWICGNILYDSVEYPGQTSEFVTIEYSHRPD